MIVRFLLLEMKEPILNILLVNPQWPDSNIPYLGKCIIWDLSIEFIKHRSFRDEGEFDARDPEVSGVGVGLVVYRQEGERVGG